MAEASSSSNLPDMEVTLSHRAPAKGLEALPTELLLKVFADVPNKELKQIAISSKKLAAPAQEKLFCTLTIAPRRRQLRVLMHVSKHPVLSTYVKHLSYDLSLYRHVTYDLADYKADAERRSGLEFTDHDILVGYIQAKFFMKEQARIMKGKEIPLVLARTLPKFPKLKAISFSRQNTSPCRSKGALPLPLNGGRNIVHHQDTDNPCDAEIALRDIFRALKKTRVQIRDLSIDPQNDEHFPERQVLALRSKRSKAMAIRAFQSLTSIEMRFSRLESSSYHHPGKFAPIVSQTRPTVVAELLQSAKGLKRLSFGYNKYVRQGLYGRKEWSHFPLFLQLGDGFRWYYLESLELVNMSLYDEEIVDFVNLHGATLKEVVLEKIVILSALGWDNVAGVLKELRLSGVRIIAPMALPEGQGQAESRPGDDLEKLIMGARANRLALYKPQVPARTKRQSW